MLEHSINARELIELASHVTRDGYSFRFIAHGHSMQPFILDGDTLEVVPLVNQKPTLGDVLLVKTKPDQLLAHRVIGIRDNLLLIRGDACPNPDGWFSIDQIIGKVVMLFRNGRCIDLNSKKQRWRAQAWATLCSFAPIFKPLPPAIRRSLKRILLDI
jgi:hypothetical protein